MMWFTDPLLQHAYEKFRQNSTFVVSCQKLLRCIKGSCYIGTHLVWQQIETQREWNGQKQNRLNEENFGLKNLRGNIEIWKK